LRGLEDDIDNGEGGADDEAASFTDELVKVLEVLDLVEMVEVLGAE
jgi:hypothetical protein